MKPERPPPGAPRPNWVLAGKLEAQRASGNRVKEMRDKHPIGSIPRECVDHIVLGRAHARRVLKS
jgi:hypothetical protein